MRRGGGIFRGFRRRVIPRNERRCNYRDPSMDYCCTSSAVSGEVWCEVHNAIEARNALSRMPPSVSTNPLTAELSRQAVEILRTARDTPITVAAAAAAPTVDIDIAAIAATTTATAVGGALAAAVVEETPPPPPPPPVKLADAVENSERLGFILKHYRVGWVNSVLQRPAIKSNLRIRQLATYVNAHRDIDAIDAVEPTQDGKSIRLMAELPDMTLLELKAEIAAREALLQRHPFVAAMVGGRGELDVMDALSQYTSTDLYEQAVFGETYEGLWRLFVSQEAANDDWRSLNDSTLPVMSIENAARDVLRGVVSQIGADSQLLNLAKPDFATGDIGIAIERWVRNAAEADSRLMCCSKGETVISTHCDDWINKTVASMPRDIAANDINGLMAWAKANMPGFVAFKK